MNRSHPLARLPHWLAVAAVALWLAPVAARGQVHDNAHLFGQSAVDDANTVMGRMEQQDKKQFVVETFPAVPDAQRAALQQQGNGPFFHEWMAARAKDLKVNGVYALICMDPKFIEVGAGRETKQRGIFTQADLDRLREQMQGSLKAQQYDATLSGAVDMVQRAYTANIPGAKPLGEAAERDTDFHRANAPSAMPAAAPSAMPPAGPSRSVPGLPGSTTPAHSGGFGLGLGSLICLGVAALILVSLARRVFSGGGNRQGGFGGGTMGGGGPNYPTGGPSYGAGQGPGYGGPAAGGGGGFGKGILGGLLGGAVGGYAADKFDHRNDGGASASTGGGGGSSGGGFGGGGGVADSGPSDAGAGFGDSSSGGDFGGGGGGGDAGGGGGGGDSGGGF